MGLPQLASVIGSGRVLYIAPGGAVNLFQKARRREGRQGPRHRPQHRRGHRHRRGHLRLHPRAQQVRPPRLRLGGNIDTAIRAGIPVKRRLLASTPSSFLASLGGIVYSFIYVTGKADAGASFLLDAIAAVVIGAPRCFGRAREPWGGP